MVDAYTRANIAQFLGGALDTASKYGLEQLYRRNEQERLATLKIANQMAEQGMLDQLPNDIWQRMAKNLGQNYSDALMTHNRLRKTQLAPLRNIQRGAAQYINRPTYDLIPGRQMTQQPPPMGETLDEQYTPSELRGQAQQPRQTITVGDQQQLQLAQQRAQQQAQQTGQPNVLAGYDVRQRPPTDIERFQRAEQLSPFGVALLTQSNELGQLAALGQTAKVRQAEIDYKYAKLAADRDEPTFGTIQDIVGDDGKIIKAWPMFTQNGGLQLLPIGEGEQGDAMTRTIQQMQKVQQKLDDPGLPPAQYDKLDNRLDRLQQVFQRQLHTGGSSVNVQMQIPVQDPETGEWILAPTGGAPGDKTYTRGMAEAYRDLGIGGKQEWQIDRGVMTSGNLALQTLKRIQPLTTPENVGMLGSLKRFTIATAQTIQNGPEFFQSVRQIINGQMPDLINNVNMRQSSPGFKARLRKSLNDADLFQATLATLAAITAHFEDPKTGIREQEFTRILKELQGMGFSSAVSRLSELETNVRTKMLISKSALDRAGNYAAANFGLPGRPENAPIDFARDISEPGRIFPGPNIQMPGVNISDIGQQQPQPPQSNAPRYSTNVVREQARAIGIADDQFLPKQWNEIAESVNMFRSKYPGLTPQQEEQAIQLIIRRYLATQQQLQQQRQLMPESEGK